jgi:hypothetical protein
MDNHSNPVVIHSAKTPTIPKARKSAQNRAKSIAHPRHALVTLWITLWIKKSLRGAFFCCDIGDGPA